MRPPFKFPVQTGRTSRRLWLTALLALWFTIPVWAAVSIDVDPDSARAPISPYIYGTNQDIAGVNFTLRRNGGNRMTGYNWENNASNAGSDYLNQSDNFLTWFSGIPDNQAAIPGIVLTKFHDQSLASNVPYSIITLPMAGYVAADKNGPVAAGETAPSSRWIPVLNTKPTALLATPDVTDGKVYSDELLQFLVNRYGSAAGANGIKGYSLDNEPDLWSNTHSRLHPAKPLCAELISWSIDLAKAVKRIDPAADTLGFVSYGFGGYYDFQSATDWPAEKTKGAYRWFIDYYLDQMKQASTTAGVRLLNVLDLHNYSEAQGGGARVTDSTDYSNIACNKARLQAPRAFWDPSYVENSWIGQYFSNYLPFLPGIKQSVTTFYPGTKIGFSEYNFGGENHISGGIAQADILGIFGKQGVYLASLWPLHSDLTYAAAAFNLYRNYDGAGHGFGDTSVSAATADVVNSSVYASLEGGSAARLHVIVLNKNYDTASQFDFNIAGGTRFASARVFAFDAASATLTERAAVTGISSNHFSYSLPPLTAAHFILQAETNVAPSLTTQPVSQSAVTGSTVTFTAAAIGTPNPTYQWLKNGVTVSGATNATLTLTNVRPADAATYSVVATNSAGSAASNGATLTVRLAATNDFNGDGQSDILWENVGSGDHGIWIMNATVPAVWINLPTIALNWRIVGTGDFNGDGQSDILWENVGSGDRGIWIMNATVPVAWINLPSIALNWRIVGTGDFNADGMTDILWENVGSGDRGMWIMSGTVPVAWINLPMIALNWRIVGTGDFNGDGQSDILWENVGSGDRGMWIMNGTIPAAWINLPSIALNWRIAGTGDYNGDGQSDILWENVSSGDRGLWIMNSTVPIAWVGLPSLTLNWLIAQ